MSWYVVHVQVGRELAVASLLERNLGLRVFLPEVKQYWRGKMQLGPLFPGYLFVAHDGNAVALGEIDATPGCGRLVRAGRRGMRSAAPVHVADATVEQLRHQVKRLNDGGGLPRHHLHRGEHVRITSGPLHGMFALFLGPMTPTARVRVLLDFLGREQEIEVDVEAVEPCPPPPQPMRRTRGHGRRIRGT